MVYCDGEDNPCLRILFQDGSGGNDLIGVGKDVFKCLT